MQKIDSLEEYLDMYSGQYTEEALNFIVNNFDYNTSVDIIAQIRSKLDLFRPEKDPFQGFINYLRSKGLLKGKILEIGSGYYPILAERMADEQGIEVTGIDPKLVETEIPKLKLIKGSFPEDVRIKDFDVVVAMMPCEITIPVINAAIEERKPFSIMLCQCAPSIELKYAAPYSIDFWVDKVILEAYKNLEPNANISIDRLPHIYGRSNEIITKTYSK